MHKADEQHALPPTVRNWSTTGSGAVIECGGKRIHWQQIEVFTNYCKPPIMTKIPLATSYSTEVDMSRMSINSLSAPKWENEPLGSIHGLSHPVVCSRKETTSIPNASSLAPCDKAEQPTKITKAIYLIYFYCI